MKGAIAVSIVATLGNMIQGWDSAVIAGTVIYIRQEFLLKTQMEGLVIAIALIGGILSTTISGGVSDRIGRRPMLLISSVLYLVSGLIMSWSPNVYVLLLARLLNGFGTGFVVTLVPIYISETAPSDIRGSLNTLPQFMGSSGMCLSSSMVFGVSLTASFSWRLMLAILCLPSFLYFALIVFYLPESPRWLVSKGRIDEAKQVLKTLRGITDDNVLMAELALLVEGLKPGGKSSVEEYVIAPANDILNPNREPNNGGNDQIRIYGPDSGQSWVAKPVGKGRSLLLTSHQGSSLTLEVDPLVALFGSIHEKVPESSTLGSNIFSGADQQPHHEHWDEENQPIDDSDDYEVDTEGVEEDLRSPLLSHDQRSSPRGSQVLGVRRNSSLCIEGNNNAGEVVSHSANIGAGWQIAWRWSERVGEDGNKEGELQRIFLRQEAITAPSRNGSIISVPAAVPEESEVVVPVAALVSHSAIGPQGPIKMCPQEDGGIEPVLNMESQKDVVKAVSWSDLMEPGVRRALAVGIGLQIFQQMSGINGVLYYAPQILEEAGVAVLLTNMGMNLISASLLLNSIITFLMLPAIVVCMRLMDISGRRALLLYTVPVLIVSLSLLVISSFFKLGTIMTAIISTPSVVIYLCSFVMAFGSIPNTLCSEIFPTRVRGLCITICATTYWCANILITYSFPILFEWIGLAGVFSIYAVGCILAWVFVYLKVPETKGMPLEVISEYFALGTIKSAEPVEITAAASANESTQN
ncbi:monosaccharide-sensing protein 2-like [Humulus lupulus]|uniref:monosaccharide-sensing protein 2-like n=1 Tax=Humulus lupulus TaxID=3486 RepID=UPI002B417279|nr:monosaccharide-sensing protein 2-like [Humulus lupulus]